MNNANLARMSQFGIDDLPNLDTVVLAALELYAQQGVQNLDLGKYARPMVVGSGNAAVTGKILLQGSDAVFADESTYLDMLDATPTIDGAILISASGGKHAPIIARTLRDRGLNVRLLTCNKKAPAIECVEEGMATIFPNNREPYTYNTSSYMGIILGKTRENPANIIDFIDDKVDGRVPDVTGYDAFYIMVPAKFDAVREMFMTKFDELFGPMVVGRCFTVEQTKHAKTVVPSEKELFISIGEENTSFGLENARVNIPLPADADYGAVMAIGYYVIGRLQAQFPPYFKDNIVAYTQKAAELFGQQISPIVEPQ